MQAASKESVKLDSLAGFAWLEVQASTRAKPALFVPPDQPGGLTQFLVCDVPETRWSGLQITPQCVSDLQPHSDHGAGRLALPFRMRSFSQQKVSSFVLPLRIIQ